MRGEGKEGVESGALGRERVEGMTGVEAPMTS